MSQQQPVVMHENDPAIDSWSDDVRGHLDFRTLFGDGVTPTMAMSAGVSYLRPGQWLGRHKHQATEIYFVIEGTGLMSLDGVDHSVETGSAVFVPGEVEHGITNTGSELLRFFYVFDVDAFADVRYRFPGAGY